jgi:hypothetical protein
MATRRPSFVSVAGKSPKPEVKIHWPNSLIAQWLKTLGRIEILNREILVGVGVR